LNFDASKLKKYGPFTPITQACSGFFYSSINGKLEEPTVAFLKGDHFEAAKSWVIGHKSSVISFFFLLMTDDR